MNILDKQQELDLPALCGEDGVPNLPKQITADAMSHISGIKRPLCHTNSLSKLPKYGVETPFEDELGMVIFFVQIN